MKLILITFLIWILSIGTNGQNQNISNGSVFDGEPYLSIDPDNSQHFVVAWMGWELNKRIVIKTKVSFNAGKTWSIANNLPHTTASYTSADPSIAFDNNGNIFISYIDFTGYDVSPLNGGIYVCKSTNGGLTWESPVEVITLYSDPDKRPIDRPWISIDHSTSVNQGNIYITSMNAKGATASYNPYLTVSTDKGNSFNHWRYLDTINWLAGSSIPQPMPTNCVSANGTFYAAYPSYVPSQSFYGQFILASSIDGGNNLSHNPIFLSKTSVNDTLAKKGYLIRADPSDPNHLAFFYLDIAYGDIDVFMRESTDGGINWSNAIRVNDDPIANNRMQDLLWADFDTDGDLVVSWRDRRNSTDSTYITSSEIWGAFKSKDSTNFTSNFQISDNSVAYDPILAQSGNDFMCIKLVNDTLNAVWGDTGNGKLNIWFQRIGIDGSILPVHLISSDKNPEIFIYPNPTTSNITISGNEIKIINIFTIEGTLVYSQSHRTIHQKEINIDFSTLPEGTYLIQCETEQGVVTKKIIRE